MFLMHHEPAKTSLAARSPVPAFVPRKYTMLDFANYFARHGWKTHGKRSQSLRSRANRRKSR